MEPSTKRGATNSASTFSYRSGSPPGAPDGQGAGARSCGGPTGSGIAPGRPGAWFSSASRSLHAQPRVERVAQTVAEEIEREARHREREAREQAHPERFADHVLAARD